MRPTEADNPSPLIRLTVAVGNRLWQPAPQRCRLTYGPAHARPFMTNSAVSSAVSTADTMADAPRRQSVVDRTARFPLACDGRWTDRVAGCLTAGHRWLPNGVHVMLSAYEQHAAGDGRGRHTGFVHRVPRQYLECGPGTDHKHLAVFARNAVGTWPLTVTGGFAAGPHSLIVRTHREVSVQVRRYGIQQSLFRNHSDEPLLYLAAVDDNTFTAVGSSMAARLLAAEGTCFQMCAEVGSLTRWVWGAPRPTRAPDPPGYCCPQWDMVSNASTICRKCPAAGSAGASCCKAA